MARLTKRQLTNVVERAVRESGWSFLYLSHLGDHPARYQIYRDKRSYQVDVYIWNLTPGGRNRPEDEWRIQATGVGRFRQTAGSKTLILGWQDELDVFAGFDFTKHRDELGASPSIQLREAVLHQAVIDGFAPHNKGNNELAIAFRPDFLVSYVDNLEALHACGHEDSEIEMLSRIGQEPENVEDSEVTDEVAAPRSYAVISTKRALRDIGFRKRVLTAYSHSCAMCGIQLRLIDGAHVLPASHPDSTDGTDNGVALCALHHRAFDRAFITFDSRYRIYINQDMVEELRETRHDGGLDGFENTLRPILSLPPDRRDRPASRFVETANTLRGWIL